MTESPIVLSILWMVVSLSVCLAISAGVFAAIQNTDTRVNGRRASCISLKQATFKATYGNPKGRRVLEHYISHSPLANCDHYAHNTPTVKELSH